MSIFILMTQHLVILQVEFENVFAIESGNFVSNKILTQSEFTNLENSEGLDINNDSEIGSPNSLAPQVNKIL